MAVHPDVAAYRRAVSVVIKQLREQRGWSYREFGERVGVAHTSLHSIEQEKTTPAIETMAEVASAFELTLSGLLTLVMAELVEPGDTSVSAILTQAAGLTAAQQLELLQFIAWLHHRDA